MYICPGCRVEPVVDEVIPFSTGLEEALGCPRRDVCAWYSADIRWSKAGARGADVKVLKARFVTEPFFKCPDFTTVISDSAPGAKPHGVA